MSAPRWLDDAEQRAWRAYLQATLLLTAHLDAQLQRDADMPHGYYEILVALSEAPDRRLRMSQLAAATSSSRSRLSHAVRKLEERGWMQRSTCPEDRRGQLAVLTEAGFAVLADAAPGHVEAVRAALFDPLSLTQVTQLRAIGETIVTHLSGPASAADEPPVRRSG